MLQLTIGLANLRVMADVIDAEGRKVGELEVPLQDLEPEQHTGLLRELNDAAAN